MASCRAASALAASVKPVRVPVLLVLSVSKGSTGEKGITKQMIIVCFVFIYRTVQMASCRLSNCRRYNRRKKRRPSVPMIDDAPQKNPCPGIGHPRCSEWQVTYTYSSAGGEANNREAKDCAVSNDRWARWIRSLATASVARSTAAIHPLSSSSRP
jgi:hypothetical protein